MCISSQDMPSQQVRLNPSLKSELLFQSHNYKRNYSSWHFDLWTYIKLEAWCWRKCTQSNSSFRRLKVKPEVIILNHGLPSQSPIDESSYVSLAILIFPIWITRIATTLNIAACKKNSIKVHNIFLKLAFSIALGIIRLGPVFPNWWQLSASLISTTSISEGVYR